MPLDLIVQQSTGELVMYSEGVAEDEYDAATQVRYVIASQTPDALDVHLQGKVAAGQEVGRVFVAPSGATGNFGGYMFTVNRAATAEGVVEGWVNALGGQFRLPSGLADIRDMRGTFKNLGETEEYGFSSGGFSMLMRAAANRDVIVINNSAVTRYVRVVCSGTPASLGGAV